MPTRAVVILSGGLDSTTCLAIAKNQGFECHTITFDYGQRNRAEINAAKNICAQMGAASHRIFELPINQFKGSALTDDAINVPEHDESNNDIPITYVPARNTIFLSIAMGYAETLEASAIFIGVNAMDYSGYPDCRTEFIHAFQIMANLATKTSVEGRQFSIETPIINLTKAEIIAIGHKLGVDYSLTVSCYRADANGHACGTCDSCSFRRKGFNAAGITDSTRYQQEMS